MKFIDYVWVNMLSYLKVLDIQVCPIFWKFALCHLTFKKHLQYYQYLLTESNPKRIFAFIQKKVKSKNSVQCLLCSKSGPTKLLPRELHSASQHPAAVSLNCACEHLCFISIYFVHPLVRWVLRQLLLCFMPSWLKERFPRNTLLLDSGGWGRDL